LWYAICAVDIAGGRRLDDADVDLTPTEVNGALGPGGSIFAFIPAAAGHPQEWHVTGNPGLDGVFQLATFIPHAADLRSFAGEYRSTEIEATYSAVSNDSGLMIQPQGQAAIPLRPFARDTFVGSLVGIMKFFRDGRGAITGFTLDRYNARELRFDRIQRIS
jgi:hypothetical protein